MSDCPVTGCEFALEPGTPPIAQMLLTYSDAHPTESPPFDLHGVLLCTDCHYAWSTSDSAEAFVTERFGDDIPEELRA